MSFARQLKSATATIERNMNRTWKRSVVQAFSQTVLKTPVDTGAARNSWLLGSQNNGDIGSSRLTINSQKIPDIGGQVLLYSNLPYIEVLEDGSSQQAPQGMVKVTVSQWPGIVRSNEV